MGIMTKGVNYDDDSYGGDDDRDSDDFVNDGNLHLLHWHKSTGQVGEQIILMQIQIQIRNHMDKLHPNIWYLK